MKSIIIFTGLKNYKLDKDVEIAFQGLIRNTHELVEIVKRNHNKYYYFDQPYFFATGYQIHKETNGIKNIEYVSTIHKKHLLVKIKNIKKDMKIYILKQKMN